MEALGNQFLAGAALTDDEHGPIERSRAACAFDSIEERKALADELFAPLHPAFDQKTRPTVGGKSHQLARNFPRHPVRNSTKRLKLAVRRQLAQLLNNLWQV